jgi:hypothetical protein
MTLLRPSTDSRIPQRHTMACDGQALHKDVLKEENVEAEPADEVQSHSAAFERRTMFLNAPWVYYSILTFSAGSLSTGGSCRCWRSSTRSLSSTESILVRPTPRGWSQIW